LAMIYPSKKFGHRLGAKRCAIANEFAELGKIQAGNGRIFHGYTSEVARLGRLRNNSEDAPPNVMHCRFPTRRDEKKFGIRKFFRWCLSACIMGLWPVTGCSTPLHTRPRRAMLRPCYRCLLDWCLSACIMGLWPVSGCSTPLHTRPRRAMLRPCYGCLLDWCLFACIIGPAAGDRLLNTLHARPRRAMLRPCYRVLPERLGEPIPASSGGSPVPSRLGPREGKHESSYRPHFLSRCCE
jgi:hypothetical protein